MIYVAVGLALVVNLLLLASEEQSRLPFIISLVFLVFVFFFRSYLHFKEYDRLYAWLDVALSILFSVTSVVLLSETVRLAFFYVDAWSDLLTDTVLLFVGLNLLVLLPFAIVSLLALFHALKHLRYESRS